MGLLDQLNNIMGGVGAALPKVGGPAQQDADAPPGFPSTLVNGDGYGFTTSLFDTTGVPFEHAAISCVVSVDTEIWSYVVKAQQAVAIGSGSAKQPYNQGYLYFEATNSHATAPVTYHGMLKIWIAKARRKEMVCVWEGRTNNLWPTSRTKENSIALPERIDVPVVGEDSLIILTLKADTTFSLGWGAAVTDAGGDCTQLELPVTIYE